MQIFHSLHRWKRTGFNLISNWIIALTNQNQFETQLKIRLFRAQLWNMISIEQMANSLLISTFSRIPISEKFNKIQHLWSGNKLTLEVSANYFGETFSRFWWHILKMSSKFKFRQQHHLGENLVPPIFQLRWTRALNLTNWTLSPLSALSQVRLKIALIFWLLIGQFLNVH